MTDVAEPIQVNAARSRWRADLLHLHATELGRIAGSDNSAIAEGLQADADKKTAEATIHLDLAEAEERLSVAKQERDANLSPATQEKYVAAAEALVELRSYWRGIGEALGARRPVMNLDYFPEPTDDEVLASHPGGAV
jgi:hypothetical protein